MNKNAENNLVVSIALLAFFILLLYISLISLNNRVADLETESNDTCNNELVEKLVKEIVKDRKDPKN